MEVALFVPVGSFLLAEWLTAMLAGSRTQAGETAPGPGDQLPFRCLGSRSDRDRAFWLG